MLFRIILARRFANLADFLVVLLVLALRHIVCRNVGNGGQKLFYLCRGLLIFFFKSGHLIFDRIHFLSERIGVALGLFDLPNLLGNIVPLGLEFLQLGLDRPAFFIAVDQVGFLCGKITARERFVEPAGIFADVFDIKHSILLKNSVL